VMGAAGRRFRSAACAFFQQNAAAAEATAFPLAPEDFATLNPNTGTAPVFRSRRDAEITLGIYRRLPVLVDRRAELPISVWPVRYFTMFHMTNDSDKFCTAAELQQSGAYRVAGQRWERGETSWVPLYEGKMVQAYDHRAASIVLNSSNLNRSAQQVPSTDTQLKDVDWAPEPQFWVLSKSVTLDSNRSWSMGFKDVTSPTNMRTMIAAIIPRVGTGNTLPLLLTSAEYLESSPSPRSISLDIKRSHDRSEKMYPIILGNFNSFIFDFVARQKIQGNHLNFYIVEQLPIVPAEGYDRRFGTKTAEEIVRDDVLHLTYTAHDMSAFARDQGYDGPPFVWDEEDRLRRRARLDALFFHLYGLERETAEYVLSTFPIVRREEEARYAGRFRSRDLILGYMAALAAGAPDAQVAG
jgi:hypothetical protein